MPLPVGYEFTAKGKDFTNYQGPDYKPPSREQIETEKQVDNDTFAQWDWQNPDKLGPQGQALPELATGWQPNGNADFGPGLKGWWNKVVSNVKTAYNTGYEEGFKISGLTKEVVTISERGKNQGAEADIKASEEKIAQMQEARKPKNEQQAKFAAAAEATKEGFNQLLWGVLDGLSQPAIVAEQTIGAAGQSFGRWLGDEEVTAETWKQDYNASKLAYSGIFDASVTEEMYRRIDQGVRPDLAAQEVMIANPDTMWTELIGQVVLDPLNFVTVWGKAGQAIKIEKNVQKTFHAVENPVVAKLLEDADALAKMDDAQAYKYVDDLVKSQQGLQAAAEHADDIAKAGGKLDELSKSYKLASLTADGKVAHLANQTGEILMHVVNNSTPDEALEILRGMVRSVSPKAEDAAEGVAAMLHFADSPALFSEAGNNTTVLLSRMTEKYGDNWLDNIAKLKDDPAALTKDLLGKLDSTGEEMFPSVSSMLKAEDDLKAGKFVADDAAKAKATKLAERAKQLPASVRAATRFHDTAQKFVGPVNKFFIGAYMGWSPGYAFRNFSNNSLQMLIDYGPGILLGSADNMFAKAEKIHGGVLQGAFGFGEGGSLFLDKAEGATNLGGIVQAAKAKGLSGPALGLAAKLEANAAKRIIAKTYTKTFEKGTTAMVKALAPDLKAAGFSDDLINKLPTYIAQHDGDAGKIIDALRNDIGAGVIDLFNDIGRIDPKYKSFLGDVGKWDEYAETVLQAPTREQAVAAAQKIFDDVAQAGDYVYREGRAAVSDHDKFLKMAESTGGLPETRGQLISLRQSQSEKAIQAAEAILAEADDLGAKLGLDVGTMKKAHGINQIDGWGSEAAKEARRLRELAWKLTHESKKGGANLPALWAQFSPDPSPALDPRSFRDALWAQYDQVVSRTWAGARDSAIDNVSGYLDDLKKAGAPVNDGWYESIKTAQEGAQQYDNAMVGRFGELVEETPLPYGSRTTQISQIAAKNGIETATETGIATDKKTLGIINKYADVKYQSLEDVPISVAEEAFAKKAGKATDRVTRYAELNTKLWDANTPRSEIDAIRKEMASIDDLTPAGSMTMQAAKELPRSELPPEVSAEFERVAKELQNELFEGQAGKRVSSEVMEGGAVTKKWTGISSTNANWYRELYARGLRKPTIDNAIEKIIKDQGADVGVNVERVKDLIVDRIRYGDPGKGIPPSLNILQEMGADEKTLQEALETFNDVTKQELTLEDVIRQSGGGSGGQELLRDPDLPYFDDAGNLVEPRKRILPPPSEGEAIPVSRAIHEQMDSVKEMRQWVMDDIASNFGKKQVVDKVAESALQKAQKELTQKLAENRLISSRVAQANRDFTLLNYGEKSYWDTALAYLYPFHFWYKGTYKNWFSRIASNPAILGHYARYKQILGTVHADMPEWWKYNINTNDLPGVDVENPLYFNLEATLWPLNGLTNTDFDDPSKRVNWWTYSLDFANKFGPSTWSPLNMITGLSLYAQGEKEAGERWMGRLIPQSATLKAGASLLGISNLEADPFVGLLQGGLDPYERRRVGRALAQMEQEALDGKLNYSQEQIQDAAYSQEGEIWDEAVKRAVNGKAPSQISSFLFGVGFKGRTQQDQEVDKFYTDYSRVWAMRPNITEQEFREGMDTLHEKYPFMDTVLLSRRSGIERDAGLAYTVLTRIPPGKTTDIAEAVGISPQLLEKFFADKGQLDRWSPADQKKFMSGVLDIAAVLEIPSDMTRQEWTKAKGAYKGMTTEAQKKFGSDILDSVDGYYQAKTKSPDMATAYLDRHPEVSDYMNWKAERIMQSPLLSAYYGGASMIEGYYRSQMYADIEKNLGKDIFDVVGEYNDLKTFGDPAESKRFYNANKAKIKQYYKIKDAWAIEINQNVSRMTNYIPEGEGAGIREDFNPDSVGAQNLANSLQPQEQPTVQELQAAIPERLWNLTQDYFFNSDPLPETARKQLERLANEMGYGSIDDLLQDIGSSLYAQQ
jgi:hypothetical protein